MGGVRRTWFFLLVSFGREPRSPFRETRPQWYYWSGSVKGVFLPFSFTVYVEGVVVRHPLVTPFTRPRRHKSEFIPLSEDLNLDPSSGTRICPLQLPQEPLGDPVKLLIRKNEVLDSRIYSSNL